MTTPYVVTLCLPYGATERIGAYGFTRALMEVARLRAKHPEPAVVSIYNSERADIDCDAEGTIFHDGLTDDERSALNEVQQ